MSGPYELSTRPAMTDQYREGFAWYVKGPGTGGYHGGYYGSQFNLRVIEPRAEPRAEEVTHPDWWGTVIEMMNLAYEQGCQAERKNIRDAICGALGVKP